MVVLTKEEPKIDTEFIKWLLDQKIDITKIEKMHPHSLKRLLNKYCKQSGTHITTEEFKNILKLLQPEHNKSNTFKVCEMIEYDDTNAYEMVEYNDINTKLYDYIRKKEKDKSKWKCIFLHLKNDNNFPDFIKNHFDDLHIASEQYLNIYYNKNDLFRSGYVIKKRFVFLESIPLNALPCLVLWNDFFDVIHSVDIHYLSHTDIIKLVSTIVDLIKNQNTCKQIFEGADIMSQKLKNAHMPSVTVTATNVNGPVTGVNTGSLTTTIHNSTITTQFKNEIDEIIAKINILEELQQEQKAYLSEILENFKSPEKQEGSKTTLNGFLMGLGSVATKIKAIIAAHPEVAEFLNLK